MLATTQGAARQEISAGSFLATLKGLGLQTDPVMVTALRAKFGYDLSQAPDHIPYSLYLTMLDYVRIVRLPDLPEPMAYELLGRVTVMAFFEGATGGIIKTFVRFLNDEAAITIVLRRFQQSLPFGIHSIHVERPGCIVYRKQQVRGPHELMRGMLLEMLDLARAKNPRVTYDEKHEADVEYRIEWDV